MSLSIDCLHQFGSVQDGYDLHDGEEITREGEGRFLTDLLTEKAVRKISEHPQEKPLFLQLAYQAPHDPIQRPPQHYLRMYGNMAHRLPFPDRSATITVSPSTTIRPSLQALDAGVGRLVDALKAAGLYENTVLVFSTGEL